MMSIDDYDYVLSSASRSSATCVQNATVKLRRVFQSLVTYSVFSSSIPRRESLWTRSCWLRRRRSGEGLVWSEGDNVDERGTRLLHTTSTTEQVALLSLHMRKTTPSLTFDISIADAIPWSSRRTLSMLPPKRKGSLPTDFLPFLALGLVSRRSLLRPSSGLFFFSLMDALLDCIDKGEDRTASLSCLANQPRLIPSSQLSLPGLSPLALAEKDMASQDVDRVLCRVLLIRVRSYDGLARGTRVTPDIGKVVTFGEQGLGKWEGSARGERRGERDDVRR
ncbi:hypothetical protein L198_06617 [Cryptococcus wingfieldii CBS 7118]|uniref:Uncharacterized protein n=1 Tax=Cryptococcus wingfieldii CBS 7118 TaxID=1295528 RepID=A0A1E3IK55_9TREE|nr:hypothetical protein L198_06617 [Cryptococcus wingfieldii CBS 7118]ODN88815.1 hypothetical protein L198_06617 [Cryptococcus wingfieldii CBS 7118]